MLFTWDWHNSCVVFKWWHVRSPLSFIFSLIAIVLVSMGYEWLKTIGKDNSAAISGPLRPVPSNKWKHSVLYGIQVGYSFMLMLVFMTYNGWYMLAVIFGAIIGHQTWGGEGRGMACH